MIGQRPKSHLASRSYIFCMLNSTEHEILKFVLHINVKITTIVGILTFIKDKCIVY